MRARFLELRSLESVDARAPATASSLFPASSDHLSPWDWRRWTRFVLSSRTRPSTLRLVPCSPIPSNSGARPQQIWSLELIPAMTPVRLTWH
jgi:hypothetical protein